MKDKIYLLAIALFVITFILCYFEPLCTNEAFVFITLLSGFNAVVWTFATFDKLKENE